MNEEPIDRYLDMLDELEAMDEEPPTDDELGDDEIWF